MKFSSTLISLLFLSSCCHIKTETRYQKNGDKDVPFIVNEVNSCTNLKDGISIMFSDKGDTIAISYYKDGELNGLSKSYYENGNIQTLDYFKDDKMDGTCKTYFKNRQLRSNIIYQNHKIWKVICVYDSLGNPLDFGKVEDGNGFLKHYQYDGNYEEGKIENGFKNGYWKKISNSGHVSSSFYNMGESEFLPGYIDNLY